jgi:hypothetical protein
VLGLSSNASSNTSARRRITTDQSRREQPVGAEERTGLDNPGHDRARLLIHGSGDKRAANGAAEYPDAGVHRQTVTSSAIGQLATLTRRLHELVNGGSGGLAA